MKSGRNEALVVAARDTGVSRSLRGFLNEPLPLEVSLEFSGSRSTWDLIEDPKIPIVYP
jgi:hypothetical protein